jgi:hypothetical protein
MGTMSPRVENRRIDGTVRSSIWSSWDAVVWAVSTALRWFMPERWIVDLLVLALALFLVGATAFYGLVVVSESVPPSNPPIAGRLIRGDEESGVGVFNVCTDLPGQSVRAPVLASGTVHFSSGELEGRGCCERCAGSRNEPMNRD